MESEGSGLQTGNLCQDHNVQPQLTMSIAPTKENKSLQDPGHINSFLEIINQLCYDRPTGLFEKQGWELALDVAVKIEVQQTDWKQESLRLLMLRLSNFGRCFRLDPEGVCN